MYLAESRSTAWKPLLEPYKTFKRVPSSTVRSTRSGLNCNSVKRLIRTRTTHYKNKGGLACKTLKCHELVIGFWCPGINLNRVSEGWNKTVSKHELMDLSVKFWPITRNLILSYLTILKWTAELRSPTLIHPARLSIALSVLYGSVIICVPSHMVFENHT